VNAIRRSSPKRTQANAQQVARRLGISQMTVSRAFSGKGAVSGVTRQHIFEVAQQIGYRPNPLAAGLRGSATRSIGMIWPLYAPWGLETGRLLHHRLQERGYAVYQGNAGRDLEGVRRSLREWADRRADGLIFWDEFSMAERLKEEGYFQPFEAVAAISSDDLPGYDGDLLILDRYRALEAAADHLAGTGRRRPSIILSASPRTRSKAKAFLGRCRLRGMDVDERSVIDLRIVDHPQLIEATHEALQRRLGDWVDVDAVMCGADEVAMAAIRFLQTRGKRVPEEVAVIGTNNSLAAGVYSPALASIDRRAEEVAEGVERMLFRRLEHPRLPPLRQTIAIRFVWRASAGGRRDMSHGVNECRRGANVQRRNTPLMEVTG
jgi:LacI family transcriptional regulator